MLVEIESQCDCSHEETEQQHEVEQNRGAGGSKHPLLCHAAPQDCELMTVFKRKTWTLLESVRLMVKTHSDTPEEGDYKSGISKL